jgi:hypothetical protein
LPDDPYAGLVRTQKAQQYSLLPDEPCPKIHVDQVKREAQKTKKPTLLSLKVDYYSQSRHYPLTWGKKNVTSAYTAYAGCDTIESKPNLHQLC